MRCTWAGVSAASGIRPKTARSRRRVELTVLALDALRRHRAAQREARLKAGSLWHDRGLVFTNAFGGYVSVSNLLDGFRGLLACAELPRVRFHDLRHTAATLMLARGIHPKIVSEMLGHATVAITLDLYSHVTETMQRAATREIDLLLTGD